MSIYIEGESNREQNTINHLAITSDYAWPSYAIYLEKTWRTRQTSL
jgi:hypothetical protein